MINNNSYLFRDRTKMAFVLALFFIFINISAFSNNNKGVLNGHIAPSNNKDSVFLKEKIYIHFDKPYYNAGENIWFKVYLVEAGTHRPEALSKVVYIDLINPLNEVVSSRTIKIIEGGGAGDFELSRDLIKGDYTIRAYTNFMRNFDHEFFFRKQIYVNSLWDEDPENLHPKGRKNTSKRTIELSEELKPDIQFFPEGGYMLNGFENRVGFKAVGINGKGIDVVGTIVDNLGKAIVGFRSAKFGLGVFQFRSESNQSYKANINYRGQTYSYDLSNALRQGAVIQVEEQFQEYKIIVLSSLPDGVNNLSLVGTHRGEMVCNAKIAGNKNKAIITVPKEILEEGIVQFTLFDENNIALSERLVFFDSDKIDPEVLLQASKEFYEKNALVELEIDLKDELTPNMKVDMSMAVTDMSIVVPDSFGLDIKSHLLLNSEIKGDIEQPNYYFQSKDPQRKHILDLLMRTQGWRRYVWNDTLSTKNSELKFDYEFGFRISGYVKSFFNNKKPATANVLFSSKNIINMRFDEFRTDHTGYFEFNNLNFLNPTSVKIFAKHVKEDKGNSKKNLKGSPRNFYIEMDSFIAPKINIEKLSSNQKTEILNEGNNKEDNNKEAIIQRYFDSINTQERDLIKLEEIQLRTVLSEKKSRYRKKRGFYTNASNTVDFKDTRMILPGINVLEVLKSRVPGLYIIGSGGTYDIRIRGINSLTGGTTPLIFLNGTPSDIEGILDIPVEEVDFIDVIKGPRAASFGLGSANGVIAVYTLDGLEYLNEPKNEIIKGSTTFIHPGFNQARKFYEPVYEGEKPQYEEGSNGPTLYWNPIVTLTENNKTKVSFYTGNATSNYRVIVEGITSEGIPVKSEMFIQVE